MLNEEAIALHPGMQAWWSEATALWDEHRSSGRMTLMERLDYQLTLSNQLPIPALRVLYNASGMNICSAKLKDPQALITSGLYWAPMQSEKEADYVCAILNAPITTELTRPLMAYGKDERHVHKHVWELPIPMFDANDDVHVRIAELGESLVKLVATFPIEDGLHFAATRRHIRDFIMETSDGQELNDLVTEMIG
jgi:hypothetical protein